MEWLYNQPPWPISIQCSHWPDSQSSRSCWTSPQWAQWTVCQKPHQKKRLCTVSHSMVKVNSQSPAIAGRWSLDIPGHSFAPPCPFQFGWTRQHSCGWKLTPLASWLPRLAAPLSGKDYQVDKMSVIVIVNHIESLYTDKMIQSVSVLS